MSYSHVQSPKPISTTSLLLAVGFHLVLLVVIWFLSLPVREKESVIPIDLTLVVHENLDGNEDEPPPMEKPEPPPPEPEPPPNEPEPPPPEPEKLPDPPKAVEQIAAKTNEVRKVVEKKPDPKPAQPVKSAKEQLEERIAKMKSRARDVKLPKEKPGPVKPPQPNGRTGPKTLSDAEIARLLAMGYKAGRVESLAPNESVRCVSLIREAFYRHWDRPPWTDTLREARLKVTFGAGGRVKNYALAASTGDRSADLTILAAAKAVGIVSGLSNEFLKSVNYEVTVQFKVTPN